MSLVDKYINRVYEKPSCFGLVTDFYINEFGIDLSEMGIEGKTIKELQTAFMVSATKHNLFKLTLTPQEGAIALMYKSSTSRPDHCGIYIQGKILHTLNTLIVWQDIFSLRDLYNDIKYEVLQ